MKECVRLVSKAKVKAKAKANETVTIAPRRGISQGRAPARKQARARARDSKESVASGHGVGHEGSDGGFGGRSWSSSEHGLERSEEHSFKERCRASSTHRVRGAGVVDQDRVAKGE